MAEEYMGFGDSLKKLYQKASAAAQKAFHEIAKTAEEAKDKLLKGIDTAKEKVTDAYEYGKQKVKEAIIAAKHAVDKVLKPKPVGCTTEKCPNNSDGPFDTPDEAARAALTRVNPQSIKDNLEYSGLIYRGADGKYYYSGPAKGTDQGAQPWKDAPIPSGTTEVAYYHTHADYSTVDPTTGAAVRTSDPKKDDFNSDNFSATDKRVARQKAITFPSYNGYLGTPSGKFRKYEPATGNDNTMTL